MKIRLKKLIKITCLIVILLFLCLILGVKIREQTQGRVYYGEGKTCEYWTDALFSKTQNQDYAYAFVWVDDKKADFTCEFYDDSDSLVEDFLEKKEDMLQEEKSGMVWSFLKLRIDEDIYGIDIYEYLEQNLSEEGYEYRVETFPNEEREISDSETPYRIKQILIEKHLEEKDPYIVTWQKREIVICDGYLYFLACEDVNEENKGTVTEQLIHFAFHWYGNPPYGGAYTLDEEQLYWMKYTQRESRLENPERMFIEEKASNIDGIYPKWAGYFGLMKEAEYRVQLAPNLPEMTIHFRYAKEAEEDGYEFYLKDRDWNAGEYQMEVRAAEDGRLIQDKTISLCVWKTDMISFEDIDGDGYLDAKVVFPEYSGSRDNDNLAVYDEAYLLWKPETEEFRFMRRDIFLARQAENSINPDKEETDTEPQEIPYAVSFIVEEGDSLWEISEEYYGEGRQWQEIYEYNQDVIGKNPSLILPGTELEMP